MTICGELTVDDGCGQWGCDGRMLWYEMQHHHDDCARIEMRFAKLRHKRYMEAELYANGTAASKYAGADHCFRQRYVDHLRTPPPFPTDRCLIQQARIIL